MENMSQNEILKRISDFMKATGVTKTALCKRVNISVVFLNKVINGERNFSDNVMYHIDMYLKRFGY